jgi:hypothetical protein
MEEKPQRNRYYYKVVDSNNESIAIKNKSFIAKNKYWKRLKRKYNNYNFVSAEYSSPGLFIFKLLKDAIKFKEKIERVNQFDSQYQKCKIKRVICLDRCRKANDKDIFNLDEFFKYNGSDEISKFYNIARQKQIYAEKVGILLPQGSYLCRIIYVFNDVEERKKT